ncbi:MAG TPA: exodeoxyribonuclease VII small subunit, partial [Longimicrobiales bacterium]|jgi:exodeoxyribonuclease VII small subunit
MSETNPTLEQRLDRLDEIVRALEREDLELEQAMRLFEEGIGHLRHAQELLNNAELRIERLLGERGEQRP